MESHVLGAITTSNLYKQFGVEIFDPHLGALNLIIVQCTAVFIFSCLAIFNISVVVFVAHF